MFKFGRERCRFVIFYPHCFVSFVTWHKSKYDISLTMNFPFIADIISALDNYDSYLHACVHHNSALTLVVVTLCPPLMSHSPQLGNSQKLRKW